MRRMQKEQAIDGIKLLEQAHREIKKQMEKGKTEIVMDLLRQCQETAIELGQMIEETEGEGTVSVGLLEDYCELVYQIYLKAQRGSLSNQYQTYRNLHRLYLQIENSIKRDIRIRIEAVFLPYKVSMWDSLESVWKAADEDESCDAYVVPIPYYDKNPDGSLGDMHDEGKDYPSYVPVTDYRSYDFAIRRPDMVFIHNPYDYCNHVTCVHPFFFTENLKKYTDLLVYIPYFASGGIGAISYRDLPYCHYADYIVTQSEWYSQFFQKNVRKKLLPLGTPKFDRILNSHLEDDRIPLKWKQTITGKVFFLNTSIKGVLQHGEQAIKKMIYIFENFMNTESTLIWRPHPLLETTITSMRPHLRPLYERAKQKFTEVPHGILDLSPDASIAINISDAYIGERTSSMVHLFGVLGKPVFLTKMKITENYDYEQANMEIFCCAVVGEDIWAPAGDRNCLMKINKFGEVEEAYQIPGEEKQGKILYGEILQAGHKLYLIPFDAEAIAVFDMETMSFEKIALRYPGNGKFIKAHLYHNCIYMVPFSYPCLARLDCSSHKVEYDKRILEEMKGLQKEEGGFSYNGSVLIGNQLYMAMYLSNHVVIMDLETGNYEVQQIGEEDDNYSCMWGEDGKFILGSNEGRKLTFWNQETGEIKEITGYPDQWKGDTRCFYDMARMGDEVYLFPYTGNKVLKVSLNSLKISEVSANSGHEESDRKNGYYSSPINYLMVRKLSEDRILTQSAYEYGLTIFHRNETTENIPVRLSWENMPYHDEELFGRQGDNLPWAVSETKLYSVKMFIRYVYRGIHDRKRQKKEYGKISNNLDGSCGKKIYEEIVKRLEREKKW